MNKTIALATSLAAMGAAQAVTLLPSEINAGDTNTVSFSNADVTLTPLVAGGASTFNANPTRLGIDGTGTNGNAFNDPDTDPNSGNEEQLRYEFQPLIGLSQIQYDFSRADGPGPNDGVIISGFTADPNVTFSISNPNLTAAYDSGTGTVRLNIPGGLFGGTATDINFDPNASAGQTLLMSVTDTTQAGAQFAILSISYESIPEPSSLGLLLLGGLGLLRRHR